MIRWLDRKPINRELIDQLLHQSQESNQFTNGGPGVKQLEETIRTLLEIDENKSIIAVNNGTSALHALVLALRLQQKGQNGRPLRFATSSYTFPISAQGPMSDSLIVDVDEDFGPDLDLIPIEEVDGLVVTNLFGHLVNIQKYLDWGEKYQKLILFDNAATSSSYYNGKNSLNYGVGSIISFHHTKPIGFGEGGAIIVDRSLENEVRKIINFGYDLEKCDQIWLPEGNNYKMSDIMAAYILQHFISLPQIKRSHQDLYSYFWRRIPESFRFPNYSDQVPFTSCLPVIFPKEIELDQFRSVEVKKYYKPLKLEGLSLDFYRRIICFPCHRSMTIEDVDYILEQIQSFDKSD
jgi:dTDP-4-amino-4,6-dideoxygalactose transaminase